MLKQQKIDKVQELVQKLGEKNNLIFTNYSGIKVSTLDTLRSKLREKGADYKVVKNRLFKKALKDAGYVEVDEFLKGPIGVVFSAEDLGEIAKILKVLFLYLVFDYLFGRYRRCDDARLAHAKEAHGP